MAFTVLMFVVLIVSYALMFGLVQFSENIIDPPQSAAVGDSAAAKAGDTGSAP
ncbi:MAG TPA: hypothetical protein VK430_11710 [Xanthobacteraceae bacterium]|nr:hypothetical protein [Xanthobacteraceae bacterium]